MHSPKKFIRASSAIFFLIVASNFLSAQPLEKVTSVHWEDVPLRQGLVSLAKANNFALILDRRIDPSLKLELSAFNSTIGNVLEQVSAQHLINFSLIDNTVYLGPAQATQNLRTLVELRRRNARGMKSSSRKTLLSKSTLSWKRLSTPRDILDDISKKYHLKIEGLEQVPYDTWAAGKFSSMLLSHQLTIILAGFDLTWTPSADKSSIVIVSIEKNPSYSKTYTIRSKNTPTLESLKTLAPNANITQKRKSFTVKGRAEEHDVIAIALGKKKTTRTVRKSSQHKKKSPINRYTLNVQQQPAQAVLTQLAGQLNMQIEFDMQKIANRKISLDKRISFSVQAVTFEELFKTATNAAGLKFEIQAKTIHISPKD